MAEPIRFDNDQSINRIQRQNQTYQPSRPQVINHGPSFADTLSQQITQNQPNRSVRFSNHAQQRLEKRQLDLNDEGMARLNQAIDKVEKKGGRSSLVLLDDMAFIVNVQDRMVVTAMDARSRGEGVFTQIDSVVFAEEKPSAKSVQSIYNLNR